MEILDCSEIKNIFLENTDYTKLNQLVDGKINSIYQSRGAKDEKLKAANTSYLNLLRTFKVDQP